ncbi:MAG TPA: hypothetical protein VEB42_07825 [Chitinophagaceae bacterium]|nr:hypothetical protein [Chitinophagaceae bacterium]
MAIRVAFIIWLISAVSNALLLTACIDLLFSGDFRTSALYLFFGFFISLGFSLPAFILLAIVLSVCADHNLSSTQLLNTVIITAIVFTVGTYLAVAYMFEALNAKLLFVLYASLVSVAIGIAFQWKALKELSSGHLQPDSHEN